MRVVISEIGKMVNQCWNGEDCGREMDGRRTEYSVQTAPRGVNFFYIENERVRKERARKNDCGFPVPRLSMSLLGTKKASLPP